MESNKSVEESASKLVDSCENKTRRKLIKKAGLTAPGLLILANRPAMAASCSISGFMSARVGTSLGTYDPDLCDGWSPGNWKNDSGQITDQAWSEAGVSRSTQFNTVFTTSVLQYGLIRRVENGIPDSGITTYSSQYSHTFQQVIEGEISGSNQLKDITKHAAAALLNASFLANGGGGSNPEPWMVDYVSPEDVVGLYLLYELTNQNTQPPGVTFVYERTGIVVADSQGMSSSDYANYFVSIANGPT